MKTFENQCAQGDVLFRRIDEEEFRHRKVNGTPVRREGTNLIVTHSETGHHHVFEAPNVHLLSTMDPFVQLLEVQATSELKHLREHDTHESIEFKPGFYEVRRQREHVPGQSARMALD